MIATFSDNTQATGDFLIAADGTHSVIREYVLEQKLERRYAGYVNWNGLVTIDERIAPADQWTTFVGDGKRVSLMPVSGNRFYFFFDVPLQKGLPQDRSTVKADLTGYFGAGRSRYSSLSRQSILTPPIGLRSTTSNLSAALLKGAWPCWAMLPIAPRPISAGRLRGDGRCRGTGLDAGFSFTGY